MLRKNSIPFFIIAIGSILRILWIGKNDLWYDEVFTIILSKKAPFIWNPSLYFLLMKFWIQLFGVSELSLRLPSALFSIGTLISFYILAKTLFGKEHAYLSLFLLAFSPFHLWYAQEARNYSMSLFLGTVSTYFFVLWLKQNSRKYLALYILFVTLSIYTNYFGIILYISQIAFVIFFLKNRKLQGDIFLALPIILFIPWLPIFLRKLFFIKHGFWIPKPTLKSLGVTLENFVLGYNGTKILYAVVDLLLLIVFISIGIDVIRKKNQEENLCLCSVLTFLPLVISYLISKSFVSIYLDRGFLIFTPYFYILIEQGIKRLRYKWIKIFIMSSFIFTIASADIIYFQNKIYLPNDPYHHIGTYIKKPFKPLVKFLKKNLTQSDILVITHQSIFPPLKFYWKYGDKKVTFPFAYYVYDPNIKNTNWQRPYRKSKIFIPKNKLLNIIEKKKVKRIFLLGCDWPRSGNLDENSKSIKKLLDENLKLLDILDFEGIRLFVYATGI